MNSLSVPTVSVDRVPLLLPENLVVLDVREDDEWAAGHIAGAVHIPLGQLAERVGELDDSSQMLVVCHVGGRSARATAFLVQSGFDAVNLDGGMDAWGDAGRPII